MTTATPQTAAVLEPETQKFIDSLAAAGGPPLYSLTPDAARDVLAGAQAIPVTKLPASIEDTTFPVGPTGSVRIRIVRPEGAKGTLPVVMHFHGGGWILGDKETHDHMTREIAAGADAAVVFVDYDRSPEAEYPVAIEQAFAATQYVAGQADMWDPAEPQLNGFDKLIEQIGTLAAAFGRPVLLLEGDSHVWRTDAPFTTGAVVTPTSTLFSALHPSTPVAPNVTRLVVDGSGSPTSYTRLTIQPGRKKELFTLTRVPLQ